MGSLVGAWMAVIGYALAYTGVGHFTGAQNVGFLQSLGYGPTPAQQAIQNAQNAVSLPSLIWQSILNVFDPIQGVINATQNGTLAQTSTTQPAPDSMVV